MAQFDRTKKLTSYVYSPTDPASEDAIRIQVDNSIQEIADIFYSQDAGKGASQVGINGLAYATVQDLAQVVSDSGTGTAPPADSVGNAQLATDVKVGSLASSTTTDKSSVISVTNEINAIATTTASKFRKFVSLSDLNKVDATLTDVPDCSIPVVSGKTYKIETFAKYQTTITTTGIKFFSYLSSGAGTINGETKIFYNNATSQTEFVYQPVFTIGASGLTGSGLTTANIVPINTDLNIYSNLLFKCTSTGEFRHQFASEVAAASKLVSGVTILVTEV